MTNNPLDNETDIDEIPRSDPLVQEMVAHALAPYLRLASPALLEAMRDVLEESLTTDPYPVALIRRLRADREAQANREKAPAGESGTVVRGGAADSAPIGESGTVVLGGGTAAEDTYGRRGRSGEGA